MKHVLLALLLVALAGCTAPDWLRPDAPQTDETAQAGEEAAPAPTTPPVPESARTVEEFDTTTAAARAEAADVAAGGRDLGLTIASLGAPGEPGFWLKTPLVSAPGKGRVVYPATGKEVEVDLIPIEGPETAGSRMSLAALRLIEAPLTGLPEIRVYALN